MMMSTREILESGRTVRAGDSTFPVEKTDIERLKERGVEVLPPDEVSDEDIKERLWEVIQHLAEIDVILHNTDHLSDRELYDALYRDQLQTPYASWADDGDGVLVHLDMLGGCTDEDLRVYLTYYADECYRAMWREDFPQDDVPPHVDPPHDRDRHLPTGFDVDRR